MSDEFFFQTHDEALRVFLSELQQLRDGENARAVELAYAQNRRKCVKLRLVGCDLCYDKMRRKVHPNCTALQQPRCGQRLEAGESGFKVFPPVLAA